MLSITLSIMNAIQFFVEETHTTGTAECFDAIFRLSRQGRYIASSSIWGDDVGAPTSKTPFHLNERRSYIGD